jgi:CRP-like cAMP-binding protein
MSQSGVMRTPLHHYKLRAVDRKRSARRGGSKSRLRLKALEKQLFHLPVLQAIVADPETSTPQLAHHNATANVMSIGMQLWNACRFPRAPASLPETRNDFRPKRPAGEFAHHTGRLDPTVIRLRPQDYLYREGDLKTNFYRVEKGALAVFEPRIRSSASAGTTVQGKGSYLGLGFLDRYVDNALAIVESTVRIVSRDEVALLSKYDPNLRMDRANAIDKDFEHRRSRVGNHRPLTPLRRLAIFLAAEARRSEREGRGPDSAADCLESEIAGSLLGMDTSTFATAIRELEGLGFVVRGKAGAIRLKDIELLGHL